MLEIEHKIPIDPSIVLFVGKNVFVSRFLTKNFQIERLLFG